LIDFAIPLKILIFVTANPCATAQAAVSSPCVGICVAPWPGEENRELDNAVSVSGEFTDVP
jgi:hypothetical protein